VTARYALQFSLNNATIGLASLVGFDRVAALAREAAGVKSARGTPSVAIGSYERYAAGYGWGVYGFANGGVHLDPWMLASVRTLRAM
jgi:penicillin-binding protein 1B